MQNNYDMYSADHENYGFVNNEYLEQKENLNENFVYAQQNLINEFFNRRDLENKIEKLEKIIPRDGIFAIELGGLMIRETKDEEYLAKLEEILSIQSIQIRADGGSTERQEKQNYR